MPSAVRRAAICFCRSARSYAPRPLSASNCDGVRNAVASLRIKPADARWLAPADLSAHISVHQGEAKPIPLAWEGHYELSARNQLKGKIVELKKGATTAHVRIDIGGQILTAAITNESVDELKLAVGQSAYAIIKATSVMVAVD